MCCRYISKYSNATFIMETLACDAAVETAGPSYASACLDPGSSPDVPDFSCDHDRARLLELFADGYHAHRDDDDECEHKRFCV